MIDQQPWLQGYLPILQLCLTKTYGFSGLHIDTGGGFADKGNIATSCPAGGQGNPLTVLTAGLVPGDGTEVAPPLVRNSEKESFRWTTPLLRMVEHINKTFGEVKALHDVNFEVGSNEIVGLLGDNGAGKSTLIKIITGYHTPDPGGEVYWKGERRRHFTVSAARDLGIETVYQERALADQQPVWRNIFMGREIDPAGGLLDVAQMRAETAQLMQEHMGFTSSAITPDSPVKTFSGGERQGVAITRALYFEAELIILDEPTMGLSCRRRARCSSS